MYNLPPHPPLLLTHPQVHHTNPLADLPHNPRLRRLQPLKLGIRPPSLATAANTSPSPSTTTAERFRTTNPAQSNQRWVHAESRELPSTEWQLPKLPAELAANTSISATAHTVPEQYAILAKTH